MLMFFILWYLSGVIFYLWGDYLFDDEITVGNVLISLIIGLLGFFTIAAFIYYFFVEYKKSDKYLKIVLISK